MLFQWLLTAPTLIRISEAFCHNNWMRNRSFSINIQMCEYIIKDLFLIVKMSDDVSIELKCNITTTQLLQLKIY